MRVHESKNQIIVILEKGEKIKASLKKIAKKYNSYGGFLGIGAVTDPIVGFFDAEKGDYINEKLEGEFEVLSLLGNISQSEGETIVHGHILLGDEKYNARGGHLVEAQVAVTLEVFLFKSPKLVRKEDKETGLKLIRKITSSQ